MYTANDCKLTVEWLRTQTFHIPQKVTLVDHRLLQLQLVLALEGHVTSSWPEAACDIGLCNIWSDNYTNLIASLMECDHGTTKNGSVSSRANVLYSNHVCMQSCSQINHTGSGNETNVHSICPLGGGGSKSNL